MIAPCSVNTRGCLRVGDIGDEDKNPPAVAQLAQKDRFSGWVSWFSRAAFATSVLFALVCAIAWSEFEAPVNLGAQAQQMPHR